MFFASHTLHIFDCVTGLRIKKEHINSTSLISAYDAKSNNYFYMDAAVYSWLKRVHIKGFKPRDHNVVKKKKEAEEIPDLPILFDA